ncbi:MAG: hypothetical protein C4290_06320 [Chloroflexota bacterium]
MIATYRSSTLTLLTRRLAAVLAVGGASLMAVVALRRMEEFALAAALLALVLALTAWRPRYGIYAVVLLAMALDPVPDDVVMFAGWFAQTPISAQGSLKMLVFSPTELVLLVTAGVVVLDALIERRPLVLPSLSWLMIGFLVLVLGSIGYGLLRGGAFNIALWETRALFAGTLVALLVPNVLARREHTEQALILLYLGAIVLSVDILYRRFTLPPEVTRLDLIFAHEAPIVMNFVVIMLLARLIWPANGWWRLAALAVPLILYAEMVTERRAGWISLDVGLILLAIFVFRLRRKVFYFLVLPMTLLYLGYVAAFWNAEGPLAEPARAVRSINDPEGRDVASNLYRLTERANIRLNVVTHPLTGLGFGKPYAFYFPMPDLSWWPFWHYMPHDSVLGLWMKMGTFGFLVFLTWIGVAIVRGVELLKRAANDRAAPILTAMVAAVLMAMVFSYVDLGLQSVRITVLLGFALGVIGQWHRDASANRAAGNLSGGN